MYPEIKGKQSQARLSSVQTGYPSQVNESIKAIKSHFHEQSYPKLFLQQPPSYRHMKITHGMTNWTKAKSKKEKTNNWINGALKVPSKGGYMHKSCE